MINGGFCAEHGALSDGLADSIEKCLGTHRRKKLTLASVRCGAPLLLLVAVSIALAGCLGGKATTSADQTPTISVSITQAPPPSPLSLGMTTMVAATVSDDVANAGVDWVPICSSAALAPCGSFSPAHTASGAPTTFTAPNGVPAGNTVSLTALSTTDKSKAASANVTITSNVTGVVFTQPPPATYPAGGSLNVAATVSGDPSKEGVNWKATCGTLDCTSGFQATQSGPGVPVTFLVPLPSSPTFPNIVGTIVTLTAIATADHNFSASATFIVISTVSISITQAPPPSVLTNASVPVVAVVTNDPTNSGVTWTIVSCDLSPCGSWSATSPVLNTKVASGGTATYFAPGTAVNHVILQAAATASPTTAIVTAEVSIAPQVSIAITTGVPKNTITQNASASLVATVSTDPANLGVDWTVTCGSTVAGACGSFSTTHTASGVATTFFAPSAVPTPTNTVTITATSTSDKTKTASQTVTVKPVTPASLLTGQWVMLLTGKDANGGSYALGGEIGGDGGANPGDGKNGTIVSGAFDLADTGNANAVGLAPTPKSTYSIGTDGRGQINLTLDPNGLNGSFGVNGSGSIVLSVVFVTPKHALLSETDAFGSGTGTLDLQDGTALSKFVNGTSGLNGNYTLKLTGEDLSGSNPPPPYFLVGAVGFSFSSAARTYTETSYITDQSDQGVIHSVPYNGGVSVVVGRTPGTIGKIFAIAPWNLGVPPTQFNLDLWLIDANHFVVTDTRDLFGTPPVLISGYMVLQPPSPAISGTYAFTEAGESASFNPQAVGGIFTCGSTGTLDLAPLSGTAVNIPTINAACTAPSGGRGMIAISNAGTTGISKFAAYPTLDQGLYLIELDGGSAGSSGPSGAGVAMQQTLTLPISVSSFSGKYASNFLANIAVGSAQGLEAFAGQIVSNGVSLLTGTLDVNSFNIAPPPGKGTPSFNATLATGSFAVTPANPTNGRFSLALTIGSAAGQPPIQVPSINPVCYILDTKTCLLLGDTNATGTGILQLQNTGLP
jgi:hypothetical protein